MRRWTKLGLVLAALLCATTPALSLRGRIDATGKYASYVFLMGSDFCGRFTATAIGPELLLGPGHCLYRNGEKAKKVVFYVLEKGIWKNTVISAEFWDVPDEYKRYSLVTDPAINDRSKLPGLGLDRIGIIRSLSRTRVYDIGVIIMGQPMTSRPIKTILDDPSFKEPAGGQVSSANDHVPGSVAAINAALDSYFAKYPGAKVIMAGYGAYQCEIDAVASVKNCKRDALVQHRRWAEVLLESHRTMDLGEGSSGLYFGFTAADGLGDIGLPGASGSPLLLEPTGPKPILIGIFSGGQGIQKAINLPFLATFIQKYRVMARGK